MSDPTSTRSVLLSAIVSAIVASLTLAACGSVTPIGPDASTGGAGQGGGSGQAGGGVGGGGGQAGGGGGQAGGAGGQAGARDAGAEAPALDAGKPCNGLPQTACAARADCRVDVCPGCQTPTFVRCSSASDGVSPCPAIACVQPCAEVTMLSACETRPDCHSVFQDPQTCACLAIGCCAQFLRCADGDKATCNAVPICRVATPHCEGDYVVSYRDSCFEGCVRKKDCAP